MNKRNDMIVEWVVKKIVYMKVRCSNK
jgi:hypothetical protein